MKHYKVRVPIESSVIVSVLADDEDSAIDIAESKVRTNDLYLDCDNSDIECECPTIDFHSRSFIESESEFRFEVEYK